jgi:acyl-CoA hydrolase
MAELTGRKASDSMTEQRQLIEEQHINNIQTLFGGQLMSWMDVIAGAAGRLHAGRHVTMVAVDDMQITAPAYLGETLILKARVTNAGRTSLEILVEVEIEGEDKTIRPMSKAFFIAVVLDDEGHSAPAPPLITETEEERKLWEDAEKRKELRKQRRAMQI